MMRHKMNTLIAVAATTAVLLSRAGLSVAAPTGDVATAKQIDRVVQKVKRVAHTLVDLDRDVIKTQIQVEELTAVFERTRDPSLVLDDLALAVRTMNRIDSDLSMSSR